MMSWTRELIGRGLWIGSRLACSLALAGALFVVIAIGQWIIDDPSTAISIAYLIPVAIIALSCGRVAGAGAGVLAVILISTWAISSDTEIGTVGWICRVVPVIALGVLIGDAAERVRVSIEAARHAAHLTVVQRHSAEVGDLVLQQMAAAKWMLEAGQPETAAEVLMATMETAERNVAEILVPTRRRGVDRGVDRAAPLPG